MLIPNERPGTRSSGGDGNLHFSEKLERRAGASHGAVKGGLNLQLGTAVIFTSAENGREGTCASCRAVNRNLSMSGRESKMKS